MAAHRLIHALSSRTMVLRTIVLPTSVVGSCQPSSQFSNFFCKTFLQDTRTIFLAFSWVLPVICRKRSQEKNEGRQTSQSQIYRRCSSSLKLPSDVLKNSTNCRLCWMQPNALLSLADWTFWKESLAIAQFLQTCWEERTIQATLSHPLRRKGLLNLSEKVLALQFYVCECKFRDWEKSVGVTFRQQSSVFCRFEK